MHKYLQLVAHVIDHGDLRPNRTGTRALGVFGGEFTHDLQSGFPLLTTKEMNFKSIIAELVGFIRGVTNAAEFRALGTKIWDANANHTPSWVNSFHRKGEDDLGKIYGHQWRKYDSYKVLPNNTLDESARIAAFIKDGYRPLDGVMAENGALFIMHKQIDQLQELIDGIKRDRYGRRHIVSAWNPSDLTEMALPPCHAFFQCYVRGSFLDLKMYQRSADLFLGVPFNIASYAALLHVLAALTGYMPGQLTITFGDLHIYENHVDQCKTQWTRMPRELPRLLLKPIHSLDDVSTDIFDLADYTPHPPIKGEMAA